MGTMMEVVVGEGEAVVVVVVEVAEVVVGGEGVVEVEMGMWQVGHTLWEGRQHSRPPQHHRDMAHSRLPQPAKSWPLAGVGSRDTMSSCT